MKKNSVIQFVGFVTSLDFAEFVPQWEGFTKQFMKVPGARVVRRLSETRNGFRYVSFHDLPEGGFQFNFMKGRNSEHFPEQRVKVVQAGGYMAVEMIPASREAGSGNRILAFISHDENDLTSYRSLPGVRHLTIYQAYYENCLYGHVLEFITTPAQTNSLIDQLNERPGCEAALYAECALPKIKTSVPRAQAASTRQ